MINYSKHPQKKIARHLQTMHKNEQEVEDYVAEEDKTKKSEMLSKLRNIWNHLHNVEVIRKQEGELVVKYRPDEDAPYTDFMPCIFALHILENLLYGSILATSHLKEGKESAKEEKSACR